MCMETQKTLNSQNNVEKKNKAGSITLSDFKLHYITTVNQTVWFWHKNRHIDQEKNRQHRNECIFLWSNIYDEGGKNIKWGEKSLFNKWYKEKWTATCKRIKCLLCHTIYKKKTLKIKDVNIRPAIINFLEENLINRVFNIDLSNMFWICLLRQGNQMQK